MKTELRTLFGQKLKSPKGLNTRPTTSRVREALMNILRTQLEESNWLDLFSGTGVMGCEALQNGSTKVLAIERNKKTAQICQENLIKTASSLSRTKYIGVIPNDVNQALKKGIKNIGIKGFYDDIYFNFVYIDPPYKENKIYEKVLSELIKGNWIRKDSIVICEHSSDMPIKIDSNWIATDRRLYGQSSLLFLTHQC